MSNQLDLPSIAQIGEEFTALAQRSDAAARVLSAVRDGSFHDSEGRRDELGEVRLAPVQIAMLAHLAARAPGDISVDIGFGMGSSATAIMAARADRGAPFQHFAFDPYGLPNGRGQVVQSYLAQSFGDRFKRVMLPSEIGLGRLVQGDGRGRCGLIVIDGDHRFDQVITDFFLSDPLCPEGGYIFFDDAFYPAIETAVNYIAMNRPDYHVWRLPIWNTSIAMKISRRRPSWDSFEPFPVSPRRAWDEIANNLPRDFV